tara:strand:- start:1468 stop:2589 length:1122 start_codon:yes stop_codon:yes gene_type:complete
MGDIFIEDNYKIYFHKDYLNLIKKKRNENYNLIINDVFFNIGSNKNNYKIYNETLSLNDIQKMTYENLLFFKLQFYPKYEIFNEILYVSNFKCKNSLLFKYEIDKKSQWVHSFFFLQKILNGFRKFIFYYRIKYKIKIYNESNLLLEKFKSNEPVYNLYDFENKNSKNNNIITCYRFNCSELYNICEKNIVNYDHLLMYDTIDLKNPYNNITFNASQLYNIYFFLRYNCLKCISLYTLYFSCNFDKSFFILKHDNSLRDHVINDFYKTLTTEEKYSYFNKIIDEYYPIKMYYLELDINVYNDLYNSKKHLIYNYLFFKYSYNKNLSRVHICEIDKQLKHVYDINPMLGRKVKRYNDADGKILSYVISNGNNNY